MGTVCDGFGEVLRVSKETWKAWVEERFGITPSALALEFMDRYARLSPEDREEVRRRMDEDEAQERADETRTEFYEDVQGKFIPFKVDPEAVHRMNVYEVSAGDTAPNVSVAARDIPHACEVARKAFRQEWGPTVAPPIKDETWVYEPMGVRYLRQVYVEGTG